MYPHFWSFKTQRDLDLPCDNPFDISSLEEDNFDDASDVDSIKDDIQPIRNTSRPTKNFNFNTISNLNRNVDSGDTDCNRFPFKWLMLFPICFIFFNSSRRLDVWLP